MNTNVYDHFERFDMEGDEGTRPNFSYGEHGEIPITVINSPPPEEVQKAEEISDHNLGQQDEQRQGPVKRNPRKQAGTMRDYDEKIVIPSDTYESWLQSDSDISRKGIKKKVSMDIISIRSLMEPPPINSIGDSTVINSPPAEEVQRAEEIPVHHGCKEARQDEQRQGPVKREPRKQPATVIDYEQTVIPGNIYQSWLQNTSDISRRGTKKKVRRDIISTMKIQSLMEPEVNSESFLAPNHRFMQKSIQDDPTRKGLIHHPDAGSSLEPVAEEPIWQFTEPNFKISRLSENGPTPDHCTTL